MTERRCISIDSETPPWCTAAGGAASGRYCAWAVHGNRAGSPHPSPAAASCGTPGSAFALRGSAHTDKRSEKSLTQSITQSYYAVEELQESDGSYSIPPHGRHDSTCKGRSVLKKQNLTQMPRQSGLIVPVYNSRELKHSSSNMSGGSFTHGCSKRNLWPRLLLLSTPADHQQKWHSSRPPSDV